MVKGEIAVKLNRLSDFCDRHGLDGVLLQHRANFAWITGGRDNHIANNTPEGVAAILATPDSRICLANAIESPRMEGEELAGTGVPVVSFPWWDFRAASIKVIEMIAGRKIAADMDPLGIGLRRLPNDFSELRWSLTAEEIARYRDGARRVSAAIEQASNAIDYGDSELEIAGLLDYFVHTLGCNPLVTLIASDDRIGRFRHPIPTEKKVEHYVMLVTCGEFGGLISSATRFVSFRPMVEMESRQQAIANIDAAVNLSTRPGRALGEIFHDLQQAYADNGYPDQWRFHHQGGSTGYAPREVIAVPDSPAIVRDNQAFAWNPSIPGAKSEDTILCGADGISVLTTASEDWPMLSGHFKGEELQRPSILVR